MRPPFHYTRQNLSLTPLLTNRNTQDTFVQPVYEGINTLTAGMKRLSDDVQECRAMLQSNVPSTGSVPSLLPQLNKDDYNTGH